MSVGEIKMGQLLVYLIPIAFIAVVIYVYRPSARKEYQEDAEIPLHDGVDKARGKDF